MSINEQGIDEECVDFHESVKQKGCILYDTALLDYPLIIRILFIQAAADVYLILRYR